MLQAALLALHVILSVAHPLVWETAFSSSSSPLAILLGNTHTHLSLTLCTRGTPFGRKRATSRLQITDLVTLQPGQWLKVPWPWGKREHFYLTLPVHTGDMANSLLSDTLPPSFEMVQLRNTTGSIGDKQTVPRKRREARQVSQPKPVAWGPQQLQPPQDERGAR